MKTLLEVEKDELSPVTALSIEMPKTFSRKSSTSSISSSSLSRALLFSDSKVQNKILDYFFAFLKTSEYLFFFRNRSFFDCLFELFQELFPCSSFVSFVIYHWEAAFYLLL